MGDRIYTLEVDDKIRVRYGNAIAEMPIMAALSGEEERHAYAANMFAAVQTDLLDKYTLKGYRLSSTAYVFLPVEG